MTGNIKRLLLAAILAATIFSAAAQAQYPYGGFGYGGGWGWQSGYGQGVFPGYGPRPPYFALYPPVYYSHEIVRRPVGPSPFAYPSWYTPQYKMAVAGERPAPQPLAIVNPFVKAKETAAIEPNRPETIGRLESLVPARVDNPYVVQK